MSFGFPILGGFIAGQVWSPSFLFIKGEQGAWYDPSDLTTLFQDDAGTTPVTAVGQTVGKILDKSGRGHHLTQPALGKRPQYQIDTNGKSFLLFDGLDDFLVSDTITPGIDKAQAFAGVRKLSDATTGALVEFSTSSSISNGSLAIFAPGTAIPCYRLRSSGTGFSISETPANYPAPITNILSGICDIASDTAVLRVNGVQAVASATDQGTGNFLAYPLYVGGRGGSSLFFNGRLYSLIVRFGATLDAAMIAQSEGWTNGKTAAY